MLPSQNQICSASRFSFLGVENVQANTDVRWQALSSSFCSLSDLFYAASGRKAIRMRDSRAREGLHESFLPLDLAVQAASEARTVPVKGCVKHWRPISESMY